MTRVLLVEDDANLARSLSEYLRGQSFAVDVAASAREARERFRGGCDLVLLDWALPDGEGVELLREWRARGAATPCLLLTARTELIDKVLGLELGADDYVTKPFEPRELVARMRARLRSPIRASVIEIAGIRLCPATHEVRYRGETVELTRMEFSLLKLFLENPRQVFSRDELLDQVWGYDHFPTTRTVDTHVLQLRTKLAPELFETVRGVGYRFRGDAI